MDESWLEGAIRRNAERRHIRYTEGQSENARFMLEIRDMWDAHDDDGGVYWQLCRDEWEARLAVRMLLATPDEARLLGVYDLTLPLAEQGPGLKAREFLS